MTPIIPSERRYDFHRQKLVEVGVRLQKCYGTAYARKYLKDVDIAHHTIQRVLLTVARRMPSLLH
jgi:hypothetical protein